MKLKGAWHGFLCLSGLQWIIIDSNVYDLSPFKDLHPGGTAVLLEDDIRMSHPNLMRFSSLYLYGVARSLNFVRI